LDHYHLHCIVTGGGLAEQGARWVRAPSHYLFAVRALSAVFRGKFCAGLEQLYADHKLEFHGQLQPLAQPGSFKKLLRQAVRRKWVVYAKRPFAGPRQVLAYLSRYTHRVAISPRRLLALDPQEQTVSFAWKDYADGAKRKIMTLGLQEFVRRFCLHLLPERFVKIRHFGFLSNRQRQTRVTQARALLSQLPLPGAATPTEPAPARVCPHCGSPHLLLIEIIKPWPPTPPRPLDSS
jgi:hypothetical protein